MRTKWSNQHKVSRNYYGSAGGPLDNNQKARICILAQEAFETLNSQLSTINFRDWRCQEQFLACGKESLCDCIQGDYLRLVGHFQHLAGDDRQAVRTVAKDAMSEKALAMHKLSEACAERKLELSYPGSICRRQFKCTLNEANAQQLWNLVFTVRNRRRRMPVSSPGHQPSTINNQPF